MKNKYKDEIGHDAEFYIAETAKGAGEWETYE